MKGKAIVSWVLVLSFLVSLLPVSDFFGVADSYGSSGASGSQFIVSRGLNANGFVPDPTNRDAMAPLHATPLLRTSVAADPTDQYDEQLGITFTQDFSSMSYNVTAVQQDYENSWGTSNKTGPAYLLNGLSDQGYWYQVGLSWDWCGTNAAYNYAPGFNAIYAVFAPNGTQVYPTGGGAVLVSLSVNQGDSVQLALNFSGGNVIMYVHDWNTGATSWKTYSSQGATYFVGLQDNMNNSQGFFTGLMTEQYHTNPYYGNMQKVVYSDETFAKSSAWMWIVEFNPANMKVLFFDITPNPVLFSNPTQFRSFSSNGATEYSNAYQFVTGALNYDVAITNVTCSKTIVGLGHSLNISVTAANQGDYPDTFNVTAYYGNDTFTPEQWNEFWSMGDCNRDGYINKVDAEILEGNFGWSGSPGNNPADLNSDGTVDMLDAIRLASGFAKQIWQVFLTVIDAKTIVGLASRDSVPLMFTWNTTGIAYGNYAITALAEPVTNETYTADNNYTCYVPVHVGVPGDVSGVISGVCDRIVNMRDVSYLVIRFNARPSSSNWNPNADINNDATVNMRDISIAILNFNRQE